MVNTLKIERSSIYNAAERIHDHSKEKIQPLKTPVFSKD
jgi:hypothetical protein